MRKHNQIHALGALHYEAHFRFMSKLKDFKCALWSEKYGTKVQTILSTCVLQNVCVHTMDFVSATNKQIKDKIKIISF